ncbi:glycoside hydrolase family 19 protein [Massilia sp. CMS3.1]|uniref:glycoside hydrolase family 19 protein n=1 Tax=Massilia sp. CMS3.1 TaxID=3373083 RepID=UPI003EE76AE7
MKLEQLIAIGHVRPGTATLFIDPLNNAMARFSISTAKRQAAFVSQLLHESAGLTRMVESLSYRPDALMTVSGFKGRFTRAQADRLGYIPGEQKADQEMIANIAYGSRLGNGPIHSGDGWRYRGRGPIQLTGKDNYRRCGLAIGYDLVTSPDLLSRPDVGCLAAAWFWHEGNRTGNSLNALADAGRIIAISRVVNGGDTGLAERCGITDRFIEAMA